MRPRTYPQLYRLHFESYQSNNFFSKILSIVFFGWISDLVKSGSRQTIKQQLIPQLPQPFQSQNQYLKLDKQFRQASKSKTKGLTLLKAIVRVYRNVVMMIWVLMMLVVAARIYTPIITQQVIFYIENKISEDILGGINLIIIVSVVIFIRVIAESQTNYQLAKLGLTVSNSIKMLIYHKAFKYPLLSNKSYTASDIANLSQTDAQKFTQLGFHLTCMLSLPPQIIISLIMIYVYIGASFLSGFITIIISIFFYLLASQKSATATVNLLKEKETRLRITQQMVSIIRFIKYNTLEKYFYGKINQQRNKELKHLKIINFMFAIYVWIYWLITPLVLFFTFGTMLFFQIQINTSLAFTAIILFRMMERPMWDFPIAITQTIQIWKCTQRIETFLDTQQIDQTHVHQSLMPSQKAICIQGTFQWGLIQQSQQSSSKNHQVSNSIQPSIHLDQQQPLNSGERNIIALKDISLEIETGKLVMVIGEIGCGKSSLIYTILNQTSFKKGSNVSTNGTISYVEQKPWIMAATLKQNILFMKQFDGAKLNEVLYFSQLEKDVQILVNGVDTAVGQKGVNLSGGQKARLSLARALYQNSDIYLFDDILSAVDGQVGRFIIKNTITKYLKGKTILMATHALEYLNEADLIILMDKGKVETIGTYEQIKQLNIYHQLESIEAKHRAETQNQLNQSKKQQNSFYIKNKDIKEQQESKVKQNHSVIQQIILAEDHNRGSVQLKTYIDYYKMNGNFKFFFLILSCLVLWAVTFSLRSIYIEKWCEDPLGSPYNLYMFAILGFINSLFCFGRLLLFIMINFSKSKSIHKRIIKSLLYASINNFYNRVPLGRIINRVTKDLRELDEKMLDAQSFFWICSFYLLIDLLICVYASSAWIAIPFIIVSYFCYLFTVYFLQPYRQAVRLENITSSPIVSGFISTINGLPTIRAYKNHQNFIKTQFRFLDINKKVRLCKSALESWFMVRITLFSLIINILAMAFCLFNSNTNSSLAGLLMTYTLTLNNDILDLMFSFSNLQSKMVSYERLKNFYKIKPQKGYKNYCKKWSKKDEGYNKVAIQNGCIQFANFYVKYQSYLPYILKNINITINPKEKVGIIGRTGAGKSTIIQCITRILYLQKGKIMIDGVDVRDYNLKDLRGSITVIQQQPTIFFGRIRDNLDPVSQFSLEQLKVAIEQCNLSDVVSRRGDLLSNISSDNLSAGQKQLICLCRAFMKKSKIILIDQATANIDSKNDQLIQKIILDKFQNSTVLTIAHRLSTLQKSDKILVLNQGEILEFGSPKQLLLKPNGIYKRMVEQKNINDYLK